MKMSSKLAVLLYAAPAFAQLQPGDAVSSGISPAALDRVHALLESEVGRGHMGAASILVARRGTIVLHKGYGHLSRQPGAPAVEPDSVYIVASITKPVTAIALMMLVERGKVSLQDPVSTYLPEFSGADRANVKVHDLLAHTSGLPDMLPENTELRREHAPLSEFVKRVYTTKLLFEPGTAFKYQSMGILLAAEIVERITGMRLRDFEEKEIFGPLGMNRSSLGMGKRKISETVQVEDSETTNYGPNTEYWRNIGAPWGGMNTCTGDLAILLQTFLNGGVYRGKRILSPASVRAMLTDQNTRLHAPWGLGFALGRSVSWNEFGELVSPATFGHAGASGTVEWADPETGVICVVLTNRPLSVDNGHFLRLVSNAVAGSVEK